MHMEDKPYQFNYCDKTFSNDVFFIWATSTALMGKYISALNIELFSDKEYINIFLDLIKWKLINASNLKKHYWALLAWNLYEDKQPELIMHNPF